MYSDVLIGGFYQPIIEDHLFFFTSSTNKMNRVSFLVVILLITFLNLVNSRAALGIDFGSEYVKVAVVKIGSPIDLILNEASKRKSENMIGILGKDRFFASHAKTKVFYFFF
jgi:hypothetical protein